MSDAATVAQNWNFIFGGLVFIVGSSSYFLGKRHGKQDAESEIMKKHYERTQDYMFQQAFGERFIEKGAFTQDLKKPFQQDVSQESPVPNSGPEQE